MRNSSTSLEVFKTGKWLYWSFNSDQYYWLSCIRDYFLVNQQPFFAAVAQIAYLFFHANSHLFSITYVDALPICFVGITLSATVQSTLLLQMQKYTVPMIGVCHLLILASVILLIKLLILQITYGFQEPWVHLTSKNVIKSVSYFWEKFLFCVQLSTKINIIFASTEY